MELRYVAARRTVLSNLLEHFNPLLVLLTIFRPRKRVIIFQAVRKASFGGEWSL